MKNQSKKKNMSKESKIIQKIKNNSEVKYKKMGKILDKSKNYVIEINKKSNTISILDNKTKILSGKFNFYGIIRPNNTFVWSYMIPGIDKRIIKQVDKVKQFTHLFQDTDNEDFLLYHAMLNQDSIILNEEEQKKLLDLLLYLGDDLYFFIQSNKDGNIQLIYLSEITEQYV